MLQFVHVKHQGSFKIRKCSLKMNMCGTYTDLVEVSRGAIGEFM